MSFRLAQRLRAKHLVPRVASLEPWSGKSLTERPPLTISEVAVILPSSSRLSIPSVANHNRGDTTKIKGKLEGVECTSFHWNGQGKVPIAAFNPRTRKVEIREYAFDRVLPRERITLEVGRIFKDQREYAQLEFREPSPFEIPFDNRLNKLNQSGDYQICRHFEADDCSGCHFLHMQYQAQLRTKEGMIRVLFGDSAKLKGMSVQHPFHFQICSTLTLSTNAQDELVVGYPKYRAMANAQQDLDVYPVIRETSIASIEAECAVVPLKAKWILQRFKRLVANEYALFKQECRQMARDFYVHHPATARPPRPRTIWMPYDPVTSVGGLYQIQLLGTPEQEFLINLIVSGVKKTEIRKTDLEPLALSLLKLEYVKGVVAHVGVTPWEARNYTGDSRENEETEFLGRGQNLLGGESSLTTYLRWSSDHSLARHQADALAAQRGSFRPSYLEVQFGFGSRFPLNTWEVWGLLGEDLGRLVDPLDTDVIWVINVGCLALPLALHHQCVFMEDRHFRAVELSDNAWRNGLTPQVLVADFEVQATRYGLLGLIFRHHRHNLQLAAGDPWKTRVFEHLAQLPASSVQKYLTSRLTPQIGANLPANEVNAQVVQEAQSALHLSSALIPKNQPQAPTQRELTPIQEIQLRLLFKKLVKKHHPDLSADPEAEAQFIRITQAYQNLMGRQSAGSEVLQVSQGEGQSRTQPHHQALQAKKDLKKDRHPDFYGLKRADGGYSRIHVESLKAPDILVIFPTDPRISRVFCGWLRRAVIRKLVYLSRHPPDQANDLERLRNLGYDLVSVQPFDGSPHRMDVLCICVLELRPYFQAVDSKNPILLFE